jgi:hypothetical protein
MSRLVIGPPKGRWIEIDGTSYVRFGPDDWYERMGESLEPVFECEMLEADFNACLPDQA